MRHPQNAEGKFWIDQNKCVPCSVCFEEAPNNIRYDEDADKSYVFKQPENDDELFAAREAVIMCPIGAAKEDE